MNTSNLSTEDGPRRVVGRRSFFALAFITLLFVTAIVGGQMFWREIGDAMPAMDLSMINGLSVLLGIIAVFFWWLWLIVKGPNFFWSRAIPALMAVVFIAASFLVEMVFDGNAGFVGFRWRFSNRAPKLQLGDDMFVNLKTNDKFAFNQFLGPNRNGFIADVKLDRDWQKNPPQQIWKKEIGRGAAGFAATKDFAVTLEQRNELEMVTCYQLTTGRVVWAYAIDNRHFTSLGKEGPRTTPLIHQGKVYALTALGKLLCIDPATIRADEATHKDKEPEDLNEDGVISEAEKEIARINRGKPEWIVDIPELLNIEVTRESQLVGLDYHVERSNLSWGRAGSPMIHENLVIVPGGGAKDGASTSLLGFDLESGDLKWKAGERPISYSSPNYAVLDGIEQFVIVNESTANGYNPETGKELWSHDRPGASDGPANCSQVTIVSDNQVLLSKGYGLGSELLELSANEDGTMSVNSIWRDTRVMKTKFTNPVVKNGYAYGLSEGILECIDVNTGETMWKKGRFGNGQLLLIGDDLIVSEERTGTIKMIEATSEEYREYGEYKKAIRGICWNPLCFVDGKLLMRSDEEAICLQLALKKTDDQK